MSAQPERFKRILQIRLNDQQVDAVSAVLFQKIQEGPRVGRSLMEKSAAEDELAEFLRDWPLMRNNTPDFRRASSEVVKNYFYPMKDINLLID